MTTSNHLWILFHRRLGDCNIRILTAVLPLRRRTSIGLPDTTSSQFVKPERYLPTSKGRREHVPLLRRSQSTKRPNRKRPSNSIFSSQDWLAKAWPFRPSPRSSAASF